MPRTNLGTDTYKNSDLTELIRLHKAKLNLSNDEVGKKIGVSGKTFSKFLKQPEEMSIKILRRLQKSLKIPKEDMTPFLI